MRIAAHLGVKDEADILEDAIAHLRMIGVDHIVAVDGYSTDGSADILARHRDRDDFWFVQVSDVEPDGDGKIWLQRNLDALSGIRADWVLFLDADERWLPASGQLRDCADLACADVLTVPRYNVVLGPAGPCLPTPPRPGTYADTMLFARPIPGFRQHLNHNPGTPWIRGVPMPKVMARPERIAAMTDGMHDIVATAGSPLRRIRPADLLVGHLPFTTLARFERKVANIRATMAVHDEYCGESIAWHWRRWLAMDDAGRIPEEFEHQRVHAAELAGLRADGTVRSAQSLFEGADADRARAT